MNRTTVENNGRLCNELEWLKNYAGHISRMHRVRPVTRLTAPSSPRQLLFHQKCQAFVRKRRQKQIQAENKKLLNSLLKIDLGPSSFYAKRCSTPQTHTKPRSLNIRARINAFAKINHENQLILTRLSNVHSVYSCKKWDKEYEENVKLMRARSSFSNATSKRKKISLLLMKSGRPFTAFATKNNASFSHSPSNTENGRPKANQTYLGFERTRPKSMQVSKRCEPYQ